MRNSKVSSQQSIPLLISLAGFGCGIAGFFLSWGTYRDTSQIPGTSQFATITEHYTGPSAGMYGYATLALAIAGTVATLWWLGRGPFPNAKAVVATIGWIGVALLTVVVRNDPNVKVFGTIGYALRSGDYTLGYTSGPGLALVGFAAAAITVVVFARRV